MKKFLFLVLGLCALANPWLSAEIKYKIQDLGTLQSEHSSAVVLNELGQVAGYYSWKGIIQPYFWDPVEGLMIIDVSKNKSIEISCMMTNWGGVLGQIHNIQNKQSIGMFRWSRNEGLYEIPINMKGGCKLKRILGVTPAHQVIGVYNTQEGQEFYFFGSEAKNLPMIFGDLGLQASITHFIGSANWNDNQSHSALVANCLFPIVHKGEAVGHIEKAIYWRPDKALEVKEILPLDRYAFSRAMSVNNNCQVICETEEGWKLVDLKNNKTQDIRKFDPVKSFNNKGYFITDHMDLVEMIIEDGMLGKCHLNFANPEIIVNNQDGFWQKICNVTAINDAGHVIGEAETQYAEVHAILLVPVK